MKLLFNIPEKTDTPLFIQEQEDSVPIPRTGEYIAKDGNLYLINCVIHDLGRSTISYGIEWVRDFVPVIS